jgi:hypothetical protein
MKKVLVVSLLVAVAAVLLWVPGATSAPVNVASTMVAPGANSAPTVAPGANLILARRRVCVRWQRRYRAFCARWVPAGPRRCVRWQRRYINHRWVHGRCLRWVGGRGRRCVRWVRRWTRGRCLRWVWR